MRPILQVLESSFLWKQGDDDHSAVLQQQSSDPALLEHLEQVLKKGKKARKPNKNLKLS